jgi:hypothetical protein
MDWTGKYVSFILLNLGGEFTFYGSRYGIVWSMARPLVERGINLLYLSTSTAANVLVDECILKEAVELLEIV